MKKVFIFSVSLLSLPLLASAQSLQDMLPAFMRFLNGFILPLLFALAFLFFIINIVRYFIIDSANEQGREQARALAVYGVAAFVLFLIFFGIVNMLGDTIGIRDETSSTPDYIELRSLNNPTTCPNGDPVCREVLDVTVCRCQ